MKMFDREVTVAFKAGSHMRNLQNEHSDEDWKYFVLPTREDLFYSKVFKDMQTSETIDIDVQDVRRLESLFYKANPAYLDLLFSPQIEYFGYEPIWNILEMKEDIARMNLSNLYSASMGSFNQNIKDIQRPTSDKVRAMIEEHGYNTKKAMQAIYFGITLFKYHDNGYSNYGECIWYEGQERELMINIKRGAWSWEKMELFLRSMEKDMKLLEEDYKSHNVNENTLRKLQYELHRLVFDSLTAGVV